MFRSEMSTTKRAAAVWTRHRQSHNKTYQKSTLWKSANILFYCCASLRIWEKSIRLQSNSILIPNFVSSLMSITANFCLKDVSACRLLLKRSSSWSKRLADHSYAWDVTVSFTSLSFVVCAMRIPKCHYRKGSTIHAHWSLRNESIYKHLLKFLCYHWVYSFTISNRSFKFISVRNRRRWPHISGT